LFFRWIVETLEQIWLEVCLKLFYLISAAHVRLKK
jgi:hypothetical protein